MSKPSIGILPFAEDGLKRAVEEGGGSPVESADADALVWTNPGDPEGLKEALSTSPATWVQLPFAGIESFFEAGVVDDAHTWTCAKEAYGPACGEHALALTLAAARRMHVHLHADTWRTPGLGSPERRLKGTTALVFGAGGIGRSFIEMAGPFEMRVIAVNRSGRDVPGAERTVTSDELAELVPEADFVIVTAALTEQTRGIFDATMFRLMKRDAWIVNVARGGLIVTDDLVAALTEERIGGAALDVTEPEPLPDGHPLWSLDNTIITPHIANTWDMALPELRELVRRNVAKFVAGEKLEGLVDPALGY